MRIWNFSVTIEAPAHSSCCYQQHLAYKSWCEADSVPPVLIVLWRPVLAKVIAIGIWIFLTNHGAGFLDVVSELPNCGCQCHSNMLDAYGMIAELPAVEKGHAAVIDLLSKHLDGLEEAQRVVTTSTTVAANKARPTCKSSSTSSTAQVDTLWRLPLPRGL